MEKSGIRFSYGWIVVVVSLLVTIASYGGSYSFGIFFKPLREDFGWTSAATSGAFSFFLFWYCLASPLCGWSVDRFGPRVTIGLGGLLIGSGMFLTSQVTALWQIYFTYGVMMGLGMSTIYVPLVTNVSRWIEKRRGLALGIVTSGIGAGTLIMSPLATSLISIHGWKYSYMVLGPVIGCIVIGAAMLLKKKSSRSESASDENISHGKADREKDSKEAEAVSFGEALHTSAFWLLCAMEATTGFGLQTILVHIVPYLRECFNLDPMAAATVFSIIGGASIVGRLSSGAASDYIGRKMALAIATSMEGLMIIAIMSSSNLWMLYASAAMFGLGYGGHVPQLPAITGELFGLRRMGTILGTEGVFYGIAGGIGSLLAGHIFDKTGQYGIAFGLAATGLLVTATCTFFLKKPKRAPASSRSLLN